MPKRSRSGPRQLPGAGRRAHQREARQVDADTLGAGAFANHDVEGEILQRGVQNFLDLTR